MSDLMAYERLISTRIMQYDVESIYSLMTTERDDTFAMEIIPYFALFVQACQEYMGGNFLPENIAKDIKDIRNYIKKYADGFGKSQKRIKNIDAIQDKNFRDQLRFGILKKAGIYLNLGTYWIDDGIIIGNTQQLADFLSVADLNAPEVAGKHYEMGYQIGAFVNSVREGFAEVSEPPVIIRNKTSLEVNYYCDFNTNRKNKLFAENLPKEFNLFFLHLLCNMNFVKHILRPLFKDGNLWSFRVEYIVAYYTLRALERLKNHFKSNNEIIETKSLDPILLEANNLFKTKLRNCMMHYNLENAEVISLTNIDKPFWEIIENCFEGMEYQSYLLRLHQFSDMVIGYLEKQFNFSEVKLKVL